MPASAAAEMAIDSLEEGDDAMAKKEKKDKKDRKERKKEKKDKKEKKEKDRFKPY